MELIATDRRRQTLLRQMVELAQIKWGRDITPCAGRTWEQCITFESGKTILWFNTPDHSTRTIIL